MLFHIPGIDIVDLNNYDLVKKIYPPPEMVNADANSEIYLIKDKISEEEELVLKTIPYKKKNRNILLLRENYILKKIQNPTVFINVLGYSKFDFSNNENISILMKYFKNGSLFDFLNKKSSQDPTNLQIIITGIAFGMMILHKHNIMHRDLKPENILIDEKSYPHIIDFGISKFLFQKKQIHHTACIGTKGYSAPEVQSGVYNEQADVYSFGMILEKISRIIHFNKNMSDMMSKCLKLSQYERPSSQEIFKKLILEPNKFKQYINFDNISTHIFEKNQIKSNLLKKIVPI